MISNNSIREEDEQTQLGDDDSAAAAESVACRDDADSSSGSSEPPSSSSQGTSGGAGYSGDYSSISDSSEIGGSQSKPEAVRDGRGGKKVSEPILKNKGGTYVMKKRPIKRVGVVINATLPSEDPSNGHIHQHHHLRNHQGHHHHHHHHHQAMGSNVSSLYSQDANSDEDQDINRKINEIMSLYKVSLQAQRDVNNNLNLNVEAAAKEVVEAASFDRPMQVENSQPQNILATKMPSNQNEAHDPVDSSECYANLVEACRPFFNDSRALMTGEQPHTVQKNAGTDEAHSSSGFTSFFTTTNQSGSNSNANGSGGSSNDSSNKKKDYPQPAESTQEMAPQSEQDENAANDTSSETSETSSLVVQARVKRKYKEQSRRTSSSNSDNTISNQKISNVGNTPLAGSADEPVPLKRVRIETAALDAAKSKEKTKSKHQQQRTECSSLTSSLSASTETNSAHKAQAEGGEDSQNQDTSTSSKPRVVSESSSGTTTTNNSSGSGTGSGNDYNTTSKSDSGGDGASDQQKFPADRDTAESDMAGSQEDEKQKPPNEKPLIRHHYIRNEKKPQEASMKDVDDSTAAAAAAERQDEEDALVSKEKRLEKKRKRMVSRREYEEELRQMRDSSENNSDAALEPAMPVTLEEVLSLTKTARLLVQSLPPFLGVHINAAFTNLCGIQSSSIIGRPVATFISLPSSKEGESSGSEHANSNKMSSLSGSADDTGRNGSNGSRQEGDAATSTGEGNFQNLPSPPSDLRIDRLIVARGYGHIHNVVLECHRISHCSIEGSEVKFIEGNSPSKSRKKTNPKLLCRMSVSPVVSSSARTVSGSPEIQPDKGTDSGNKRRKHKHPPELQSVKHYLIQMEAADGPHSLVSGSSFASCATDTTLEAQLLGITKAEFHARQCRLESRPEQNVGNQQVIQGDQRENEDSPDDNSSAMELVATCG